MNIDSTKIKDASVGFLRVLTNYLVEVGGTIRKLPIEQRSLIYGVIIIFLTATLTFGLFGALKVFGFIIGIVLIVAGLSKINDNYAEKKDQPDAKKDNN